MFLFKLLCVTLIIAVVQATNPDNEHSINILGYQCETNETEIRQTLKTSKAFLVDQGNIQKAIDQMAVIFPVMQKLLDGKSEWRMAFARTIQNQTHRAIAENELRSMEASMERIVQNFRYLNESSNSTFKEIISIVHNLHDDFDKLVNQFHHRDAIFRKYPLLAIPPLFTLVSYNTVYNRIESALIPALTSRSDISGKLVNTLIEYRPLAVHHRLNLIKVTDAVDPVTQKSAALAAVEDLPYDTNGYRSKTSQTYDCYTPCKVRMQDSKVIKTCWIDPVQNGHYSTKYVK